MGARRYRHHLLRSGVERRGQRPELEIQRYGKDTVQGNYRLHGSDVVVTFYGDKVGELEFVTPYYRTKSGFGVGSTIPLGPCHKTATNPCERRWNGFIYNVTHKEDPCSCWVKVGRGARSLPATSDNFEKPLVHHLPPAPSRRRFLLLAEVR
jgi:hypothetical protein